MTSIQEIQTEKEMRQPEDGAGRAEVDVGRGVRTEED